MPPLPAAYRSLAARSGPPMLLQALKLYGTTAAPGTANNPAILEWAAELGPLAHAYTADSIPWCGLFMGVIAHRAGEALPDGLLWALNWSRFGQPAAEPMLGDVLVFRRQGGGHVTLCVGSDAQTWHCLGGNQAHQVSFERIPRAHLHMARRGLHEGAPAPAA